MGAMCNVDKSTNRFDVDFEKVVSFYLQNPSKFVLKLAKYNEEQQA